MKWKANKKKWKFIVSEVDMHYIYIKIVTVNNLLLYVRIIFF